MPRKAPAGVRRNYTLRLSDSELATLTTKAAATDMPLSDYIRNAALNWRPKRKENENE